MNTASRQTYNCRSPRPLLRRRQDLHPANFLARVESLRAEFAKALARDPKLIEEATAKMTAQLGTMMRSLTNQMGKIVEENHPIPEPKPTTRAPTRRPPSKWPGKSVRRWAR